MTDTFDPATRSRIMARVRSTDTAPEMKVRRAIHAAGFRYRLHRKELPGSPDLVFSRFRFVVFVHGCQWHWHGCKRSRMPTANRAYWERKIGRNVERDRRAQEALTEAGWRWLIIWECELQEGIAEALGMLNQLNGDAASRIADRGVIERVEVNSP